MLIDNVSSTTKMQRCDGESDAHDGGDGGIMTDFEDHTRVELLPNRQRTNDVTSDNKAFR
jgi:hypothetical protein